MSHEFLNLCSGIICGTFNPFDGDAGRLAYAQYLFNWHADIIWC